MKPPKFVALPRLTSAPQPDAARVVSCIIDSPPGAIRARTPRPRRLAFGSTLIAALLVTAAASADIPVVYHSPNDDGVPAVAPAEVHGAGGSVTLHLYIDGGSVGSPQAACSAGSGDEICAYDLSLAATAGLSLSNFAPAPNVDHHLTLTTLGIVGGDPWRGHLGPIKIGDVDVQGPTGATLDILPSQSVNAAMGIDVIPQSTIVTVPEPGALLGLIAGGLLLGVLGSRRRGRVSGIAMLVLSAPLSMLAAAPAQAQVSTDCGDVVPNGVIDIADIDAIREFLTGDPTAPDLQGDPQGLARCDVSGNGLCEVDDYAGIRRYMLDLPGGLNETCPLTGTSFAPVVLPPPTVDQGSTLSTDQASVVLSGEVHYPNAAVWITGDLGRFQAAPDESGVWQTEVPLLLGQPNALSVFQDFGGGYSSEQVSVSASQNQPAGGAALEGRIFDATTGEPILDTLSLSISGATHATDQFGRFAIPGLPHGVVAVRAEASGYVPAIVLWQTSGKIRPLADVGPNHVELEIRLTSRASAVTIDSAGGTITTPSGIELVVPPGSIATPTPISLTELSPTEAPGYALLPVVDIGPGPMSFDPPAQLRFPFDPLPDGATVEVLQVDHPAFGVTSVLGSMESGYLEVPISASNGDPVGPKIGIDIHLDDSFVTIVTNEFPITGNCENDKYDFNGSSSLRSFTPGTAGLSEYPSLVDALTRFPNRLPGIQYVPNLFQTIVPRGQAHTYSVTLTIQVEYYDVFFWEPVSDSRSVGAPLGRLAISYPIAAVPVLIETRALDCSCGSVGGGSLPEEGGGQQFSSASSASAAPLGSSPAGEMCMGAGWGDPHLIRFDHVGQAISQSRGSGRYDFQASGEFVLFESTEDGMVVQARMEPANNSTTATTAAAMDVDGDRVTVFKASVLDVRIEGVPTPLVVGVPMALPGGGELERGTAPNGRDQVWVRWSDGSEMRVAESSTPVAGSYLNMYPSLVPSRSARVQGLLGNANGVLTDDLRLRDGSAADSSELYTTYADSWRISQLESLFDYEVGEDTTTYNGVPTDPDYTVDDLDPGDVAAATVSCNAAGIVDDPWLSECIIDVVVLGDASASDAAADAQVEIPDKGVLVSVPGDANIFGAGLGSVPDFGGGGGNGTLPVEFTLPAGTGRTLRVLDAAGTIAISTAEPSIPNDGLGSSAMTWGEWGGLPGPNASRYAITMGVFLDASSRPATTPAPYACGSASGHLVVPDVGQIFCLGDGLTPEVEPQSVLIPDDATRLFLGFAESLMSQLLEPAIHHLGDDFGTTGLFALAPNPEGSTWTSDPFDTPTSQPLVGARVLVDLVNVDFDTNELRVNSQFAGYLPTTGGGAETWVEAQALSFDPALLTPTGNTIELVAASQSGNLDDHLFRNARIELVVADSTQMIEAAVHHLGDDTGTVGLWTIAPTPEGTSWTSSSFDALDAAQAVRANVTLDVANTDFENQVLVNGVVVGSLPITGDFQTSWTHNGQTIPFDPSLLQTTGNSIEIVSESSGGNFDDFLFRNVGVALTNADGPPGGYDDNSGMQEIIIEISP